MKSQKWTKKECEKISMSKRFGFYGENCLGIWGEGDTVEDAISDSAKNIRENNGKIFVIDEYGDETDELQSDAQLIADCQLIEMI